MKNYQLINKLFPISILKILTILFNFILIKVILIYYPDNYSNKILNGLFLLPFISVIINFGCVNRLVSEVNFLNQQNNFNYLFSNLLSSAFINLLIILVINSFILNKNLLNNIYIICSFFLIIIFFFI